MTKTTRALLDLGLAAMAMAWLPQPAAAGERGEERARRSARVGGLAWLLPVRGSESDAARSVAIAPDGAVLVAGQFDQELTVGLDDLVSEGDGDGFLLKLSRDGRPLWAHRFGGPGVDAAAAVVVDRDGNATVIGTRGGELTFSDGRLPARRHEPAFALSFTPDGDSRWATSWGTGGESVAAASLAPDGGILVVGSRERRSRDRTGRAEDSDGFLIRLDPSGEPAWTVPLGGPRWDQAHAVAVARDGTIWVAGTFAGGMVLGSSVLVSAGGDDGFLASLDPDGHVRSARRIGGPDDDAITSLAVTADGAVAVAGWFEGRMMVGGDRLVSAGPADAFVAVLDPHGVWRWARQRGGEGFDGATAMAPLPDGGLLVAGDASELGDGTLTAAPGRGEVVRFDSTGRSLGVVVGLDGPLVAISGIAVADRRRAVVVGWFLREARVGGRALRSRGDFDGLVAAVELSVPSPEAAGGRH